MPYIAEAFWGRTELCHCGTNAEVKPLHTQTSHTVWAKIIKQNIFSCISKIHHPLSFLVPTSKENLHSMMLPPRASMWPS